MKTLGNGITAWKDEASVEVYVHMRVFKNSLIYSVADLGRPCPMAQISPNICLCK